MKPIYLSLLLFSTLSLSAQDILQKQMSARVRTTYEVIPLTKNRDLGTLGTNFDWHPFDSVSSLYTGLGFLSSISGKEGGFFAFGYTLGVNYELYKNIHTDMGMYVGAGAGEYIAFANGGMIVRSHAALSYTINGIDLVLGVSRTDFPNTRDNKENQTSYHPYVGVNIETNIWSEVSDSNYTSSRYKRFDGVFKDIRITPAMLYYDVDNKTVKKENYVGDARYQDNFPALGIELEKFLTDDIFVSLEAFGALGSAAGYAAIQAGLGYDYRLFNYLTWESKMVVGSAGDSRIDTGGGLILQPLTGVRIDLSPSISLKTLVGRTYAPTGLFSATTYEVGLSFATSYPKVKKGTYLFSSDKFNNLKWVMTPSIKAYFPYHSTHKDTQIESQEAISLLGITMAVPLNDYISLAGSTHWAMTGNIGSYAEGLFGLQLFSPNFSPLNIRVKTSAQIGAGAGSGVNTSSGGYVTQIEVGLDIPLSKNTSLNAAIGQMQTSDDKFQALSILLGINIHLNYLYEK
ncbi:hypothetical protein [Sulfurimonas sp.]